MLPPSATEHSPVNGQVVTIYNELAFLQWQAEKQQIGGWWVGGMRPNTNTTRKS